MELVDFFQKWCLEPRSNAAKELPLVEWTDWMLEILAENGDLSILGVDDGPCNGVNPCIRTNAFDMNDPGDYYFDVENSFDCEFEEGSFISIYILNMEVNEPVELEYKNLPHLNT